MYKLSISIFLVGWFYKMIILSWKKGRQKIENSRRVFTNSRRLFIKIRRHFVNWELRIQN